MKIGYVTATHPEDHSVDLVMLDDGSHLAGVQVMAGAASTRSGDNDLPAPGAPPSGDKWSVTDLRSGQDLIAVVGYIGRVPLVFGFLFPQVCQMLFARTGFRVDRHTSDWYTTVDANGNVEMAHPSGTFVRVAENPEHEDLTGQDFDKKWKIDRNTTRAPWLSVMLKNAGAEVMRLRCDPAGNVTLHNVGTLTAQVDGNTAITTPQLTLTGKLIVNGDVATTGALTNNGTNVGSSHTHSDPQGGRTGGPG